MKGKNQDLEQQIGLKFFISLLSKTATLTHNARLLFSIFFICFIKKIKFLKAKMNNDRILLTLFTDSGPCTLAMFNITLSFLAQTQ